MSDLIDRKLKKMNKEIKFDEVPFDQRHMHKSILQSLRRKPKKQSTWIKKSSPIPAAVILLIITGLHLSQAEPNTETAGLMTERIPTPELKTATSETTPSFAKQASPHHANTSKMVRETYVIHEDEQFIQTGKRVTSEELGEVIGTVEQKLPDENTQSLASVAHFLPETKIYKIKGNEAKDRIAIQSWRSTGIGTTAVSKQGYFVFEKTPAMSPEGS